MFLVVAAISPVILFHEILGSNIAIAVLADSIAVGFTLYALIEIFSPICTSFFNPAVTIACVITEKITYKKSAIYSINQIFGGLTGLLISHLMFYHEIPKLVEISTISRSGGNYIAEILGIFFVVLAIFSLVQQNSKNTSQVIGFLVAGMLLTTPSTIFANPQVTFARIFTYSIAGISPIDGLIFVTMQIIGTLLAIATWKTMKFTCCDYTCSE